MLLANAILTAQFGMEFLGGTWGAILMLLFFDIAAISWYTARLMSGLSGDQRATAQIMSVATIVGSTLVSVVQVLMMREAMDVGLAPIVSTAAVWLVTSYAAFNFFALFFFQYSSIRERIIGANEELSAQTADEVAQMRHEAHTKAMAKARQTLMGKTDAIGARIAYDVERDFLRTMGCLDLLEVPATQPDEQPTNKGAGAGAIEVVRSKERKRRTSPTPPQKAASADACDCGMPIGTEEGECDFELGGPGCMIDEKAAEQKEAREADDVEETNEQQPEWLAPIDISKFLPGK